MKTKTRIGLLSILCFSVLSNALFASTLPNSSIDLTYDGTTILNHFPVSNAYKSVEKVDNAKKSLESDLKNLILSEEDVTTVHYVDMGGALKLEFIGSNGGLVDVSISGISVTASGKGNIDVDYVGNVKFDWDLMISNIELTAQYSFVTGQMNNIQLVDNYDVTADFDISGTVGFFVDVVDAVGIFDAQHYFEDEAIEFVHNNLDAMFEDKFSGESRTFFALDQVIPATIIYQGQNISPQIIDALIAPINGKKVTISTDLEISTNQSLTVNLWDSIIITARRIKPVINMVHYEYNNCVGNNRSGNLTWGSAGSYSSYTLQKKAGSNWYAQYSGSDLQSYISGFSGTQTLRIRALRQEVLGEWRTVTISNPSCSFGGGGHIN